MKKRLLSMGLVLTMALTSIVGCGKDDDSHKKHHKDRDEETSSDDDRDEDDEKEDLFSDSIFGKDKEDESDYSDEDDEYESDDYDYDDEEDDDDYDYYGTSYSSASPTKEIMNAGFDDFKFQVDETVFTVKPGDTFEDFFDQFPDDYVLKGGTYTKEEVDTSRLINSGATETVYVCYESINNSHAVMLSVTNPYDETCELGDCVIIEFELSEYYEGVIYLPRGIVLNDDDAIASDDRFNYDNILDSLKSYGVEEYNVDFQFGDYDPFDYIGVVGLGDSSSDLYYYIYVCAAPPDVDWLEEPIQYEIVMVIDQNTRQCSEVTMDVLRAR